MIILSSSLKYTETIPVGLIYKTQIIHSALIIFITYLCTYLTPMCMIGLLRCLRYGLRYCIDIMREKAHEGKPPCCTSKPIGERRRLLCLT